MEGDRSKNYQAERNKIISEMKRLQKEMNDTTDQGKYALLSNKYNELSERLALFYDDEDNDKRIY